MVSTKLKPPKRQFFSCLLTSLPTTLHAYNLIELVKDTGRWSKFYLGSSILPTMQPMRTWVPATANMDTILEQEAKSTRAILAFKSRSGDQGNCTYNCPRHVRNGL